MNISSHSFTLDPCLWHQKNTKQLLSQRQTIKKLCMDKDSSSQVKLLLLNGIKETLKAKLNQVTYEAQQISTKINKNQTLKNLVSENPYIMISKKCLKQVNEIQMNSMQKMQELINKKNSMKKEKKKEFILKSKDTQENQQFQTFFVPNTKMISSVLIDPSNNQKTVLNKSTNFKRTLQNNYLQQSIQLNSSLRVSKNLSKLNYSLLYKSQICSLLQPILREVRGIYSKNKYLIKILKHGYKKQVQLNIWMKLVKRSHLNLEIDEKRKQLKILDEIFQCSKDKRQSDTTSSPNQKQSYENVDNNKIFIRNDISLKRNLLQNEGSFKISQNSRQISNSSSNQSRMFKNNSQKSMKNYSSRILQNNYYHTIEQQENEVKSQDSQEMKQKESLKVVNILNIQPSRIISNNQTRWFDNSLKKMNSRSNKNQSIMLSNSSSLKSLKNIEQSFTNYSHQRYSQEFNFNNETEKFIQQVNENEQNEREKSNNIFQNKDMLQQLIKKIEEQIRNEEGQDLQDWQIQLIRDRKLSQLKNKPTSSNITQPSFSKKFQNQSKKFNQIPTFSSVKIDQNAHINLNQNIFSSKKQNSQLLSKHFQQSNKENSSLQLNTSQNQTPKNNQNIKISSQQKSNASLLLSKTFNNIFSQQKNNQQSSSITKKNSSNPFSNISSNSGSNIFGISQNKSSFNPFESLKKPNSNKLNQQSPSNPFQSNIENSSQSNNTNYFMETKKNDPFSCQSKSTNIFGIQSVKQQKNIFGLLKNVNGSQNKFGGELTQKSNSMNIFGNSGIQRK